MNDVAGTILQRAMTHGNWSDQSAFSQCIKVMILEASCGCMDPQQKEAMEMICVKISRICHGDANEPDHWKDIAGYATLVYNELEKNKVFK